MDWQYSVISEAMLGLHSIGIVCGWLGLSHFNYISKARPLAITDNAAGEPVSFKYRH